MDCWKGGLALLDVWVCIAEIFISLLALIVKSRREGVSPRAFIIR